MATKTASLETTLERLTAERDTLQTALADLQAQRAAHADTLADLQAQAERSGAPDALQVAEDAEAFDYQLGLMLQRKQAALRSVGGDIAKAQRELEHARREDLQAKLENLRGLARKACDRLEKDLSDQKGWQELQALHDQARALVGTLEGEDAIFLGKVKGMLWQSPVPGLRAYLDSLTRRGIGWSLHTVATGETKLTLGGAVDKSKLPRTLRQSMGL